MSNRNILSYVQILNQNTMEFEEVRSLDLVFISFMCKSEDPS